MELTFDWVLMAPVAIPAIFALLVLLMSPFFRGASSLLGWTTVTGLAVTLFATAHLWDDAAAAELSTAAGLLRLDPFGLAFSMIVIVIAMLSALVSVRFLEREDADHGEFYALFLITVAGMLMMLNTRHLMMILVGLEVFSVSLYALCGLTRSRIRSIESALKYFLLGAFSSGFLVYGVALLYGATGSLDLARVGEAVAAGTTPLLWMGLGLTFVGFAFKIAIVPFHHWVPDVYQGAPTNVTGFMAAATKTVAFAALLRLFLGAFGAETVRWAPMIGAFAMLTMTVANLVALAQTNVKRLLAFSSISHAGYLLIAVVCDRLAGVQAITFYLITYGFMTVGAFAIAAAVGRGDSEKETGYDLASWRGLASRRPYLAAAMTVFLVSMAGIPPTGGFLGKYLIFQAAIESKLYTLAIVGALNAVIAAYYYLRIVIAMYMQQPDEEPAPAAWLGPETTVALVVAVAAVMALGLVPAPILTATKALASYLS